jgi:EAL domain-containing protein (putative c-di-GMP-specific phosphodiesterase class I)
MYKAKENGKNNLQYFNNQMLREFKSKNEINKDLRHALSNKEFFLCYQPIMDAKSNKILCLEALLRWRHPKRGIICPDEFISIAEDTKIILAIGEWILEDACVQLKSLHNMGCADCSISVNVSPVQLQYQQFADTVINILYSIGLQPEYLVLEITESKFIEFNQMAEKNIKILKEQGVHILLDDFCTGFSSMDYLKRFPINSLKIDRTFISDIEFEVNKAIIESIIALGHQLGMGIVAEGVETKEQYEYLSNKGCDMIQGFYFSRPVMPEDVIKLLKTENE